MNSARACRINLEAGAAAGAGPVAEPAPIRLVLTNPAGAEFHAPVFRNPIARDGRLPRLKSGRTSAPR